MGKLLETLSAQNSVQVVDSCPSWQEAVRLCFQPLLERGFVSKQYIEAAIKSALDLNFYYLIAEGLAMPHARPEEGALKNGFSMLVVRKGINFGDHRNNPIYCIIGLAASDSNSHIDAMMDISDLFGDESVIPLLASQPDAASLIAFLKTR